MVSNALLKLLKIRRLNLRSNNNNIEVSNVIHIVYHPYSSYIYLEAIKVEFDHDKEKRRARSLNATRQKGRNVIFTTALCQLLRISTKEGPTCVHIFLLTQIQSWTLV